MLSRDLAHAGHYPAVDVLASVSRLVGEVVEADARSAGDDVRRDGDSSTRYIADPVAARYGAAVAEPTDSAREAYRDRPPIRPAQSAWPLSGADDTARRITRHLLMIQR